MVVAEIPHEQRGVGPRHVQRHADQQHIPQRHARHRGIRPDLLEYTVDRNPYKHGRFTPGTRIPILEPAQIVKDRPDVVLALPWNLEPELTTQLRYIKEWGGELVFPLPRLHKAAA